MADDPKNKKLPDQQLPGQYPYVDFTQYRDGSWHRQDSTPGNESLGWGHKQGSYHEIGKDGNHQHYVVDTHHHYVQGGSSLTTDQSVHTKTGGSHATQIDGDHHNEHGGDLFNTTHDVSIHINGGKHYQHGSKGNLQCAVQDQVTDNDTGDKHFNTKGDYVRFVGGVDYERVGSEKGTYVLGNKDTQVEGKIREYAASDILIESATKITLKVGGTRIVISNGRIDMYNG